MVSEEERSVRTDSNPNIERDLKEVHRRLDEYERELAILYTPPPVPPICRNR